MRLGYILLWRVGGGGVGWLTEYRDDLNKLRQQLSVSKCATASQSYAF